MLYFVPLLVVRSDYLSKKKKHVNSSQKAYRTAEQEKALYVLALSMRITTHRLSRNTGWTENRGESLTTDWAQHIYQLIEKKFRVY